jgi:hypothetical protein
MVPSGWDNIFFGWQLNLDWSVLLPAAGVKIAQDGYGLFGFFVMMLFFKGVLISAAGPAPNYDIQRILSAKSPREASMMSAWVNIVLTFPRYFLNHRTYHPRRVSYGKWPLSPCLSTSSSGNSVALPSLLPSFL